METLIERLKTAQPHFIYSFFGYWHSRLVFALENILQKSRDPTKSRHAKLNIHEIVEHVHQFCLVRSNLRVVNLLLGVTAGRSRGSLSSFQWTTSQVKYVVLGFRQLRIVLKIFRKVLLVPSVFHTDWAYILRPARVRIVY